MVFFFRCLSQHFLGLVYNKAQEVNPMGRKNRYKELVFPHLEEINRKIRQGVTESEIAKALGVSVATFENYKLAHPELREALSKGKGADVLQKLINAGIETACGYYKDEVTITTNAKGEETTIKTRKWNPANASLNKFYVMNFGKAEGFVNDPLDYELKKASHELDQAIKKEKNWDAFPDEDN